MNNNKKFSNDLSINGSILPSFFSPSCPPFLSLQRSNDEIGGCPHTPMPGSKVKGKFGVTALPSNPPNPRVGALGGWGIAINR